MALGGALEAFRRTIQREINNGAYQAARRAAVTVANDLKSRGPHWTGQFENSWVVVSGDKSVDATARPNPDAEPNPSSAPRKPTNPTTLGEVPNDRVTYNKVPSITIGNRSTRREIAMDLIPGRIGEEKRNTAPEDWYLTYLYGGGADKAINQAVRDNVKIADL